MEPALRKAYVNSISLNIFVVSFVSGRRISGLHQLQMSKQNEQKEREKNMYNLTSRLVTPEELQLQQNHEKILFLNVLLLFAQCKMHYW
jgi:hypothetical protein